MKFLRRLSGHNFVSLSLLFFATLLCGGCGTLSDDGQSASYSDVPPRSAAASSTRRDGELAPDVERFRVGDLVKVDFSVPPDQLTPLEENIKEDGTITLQLIGPVKAAGKTAGELQKEIHDLYVPKYYLRLNVTVRPQLRTYSVGGEVKQPGPKVWESGTTVIKAIQAAGDLTDFANKRKIQLTRANGQIIFVNYKKALREPSEDPVVLPGDKIHVKRSIW